MAGEFELSGSAHRGGDVSAPSGQAVVPAHGLGGCSCGGAGGQCSCGHGEPATRFIYVLGTVDIRFPDPSIAEELQTVAQTANVEQGADEPLRHWYHRVLSLQSPDGSLAARYVARQLCWILKVEGQIAYQLSLRDLADLPDLISCLGRAEPEDQYHHDDLDLIIGTSSLVPAEPYQGIVCPVLGVDQLVTFRKETLVDWCKTPSSPGTKVSSKRKAAQSKLEAPGPDPSKLFRMLVQSADNLGDRDEWRALNYLAVRYKRIYEIYAAMADDYDLDSVKVGTSRLSRGKHIVDPIFAFRNKQTGVVQKFFVRVDVGHLFPMIVSHVAEYFDR